MSVKINKLEIENVKRVKAVQIEPGLNGLTVIGGNNAQGKTSVLDAIAWALGGNRFAPSNPVREGSVIPPQLKVELSNGLIVERKGKNSELKVTDPSGQKAGQKLLDSFVEEFALNLPKFMEASPKDKATTLLQIIGVGDQLNQLDYQLNQEYQERLAIGRIADQKTKFAKEMDFYPNVPESPVSAAELIQQQQAILAQNGENQRKRLRVDQIQAAFNQAASEVERLHQLLAEAEAEKAQLDQDLKIATGEVDGLVDVSTEALEAQIEQIEEINRKVRANLDREKAEADAETYKAQYDHLTTSIESIREQKLQLLANADLPLPGLNVADGELVYFGQKWDGMSGAEQLKVATAIVRKLKPECGFILIDKLEQMDLKTLEEFGSWLEAEGLQAIATRVSTGEECQIIIEDGYSHQPEPAAKPQWDF